MRVLQQSTIVSLGGFFVNDDDSEDEERQSFQNETETVLMTIGGSEVPIRQMAWHRANANQVWPGSFALADHILGDTSDEGRSRYSSGKLLELGSATGALAIALSKTGDYDVTTCDIDDDGEVEENIRWNYEHNQLLPPVHIAHTWGTEWALQVPLGIKFIIGADILLYVSAYPALVASLVKIFSTEKDLIEFLMSWDRRISESSIFFDLMDKAGFACHPHGNGLFSFYRSEKMDDFLVSLERK